MKMLHVFHKRVARVERVVGSRFAAVGAAGLLYVSFGGLAEAAEPLRASVEVDTAEVGAGAEEIRKKIEEVSAVRLRDADILPARGPRDGNILVRVRPHNAKANDYRFELFAEMNGDVLQDTLGTGVCKGCDANALANAVGEHVERCLPPMFELSAQQSEAEAVAPQQPRTRFESTAATEDRARRSQRLQVLGKAGIGLTVVGVAAMVGGGVMYGVVGEDLATDQGAVEYEGRDYRPIGMGLLVGGAAATVCGVALLIVDRVRAKKRSQTAVAPTTDGQQFGVAVVGKF